MNTNEQVNKLFAESVLSGMPKEHWVGYVANSLCAVGNGWKEGLTPGAYQIDNLIGLLEVVKKECAVNKN